MSRYRHDFTFQPMSEARRYQIHGPILPLEYGRTPLAPRFRSKLSSLFGWVRGNGA